MNCPNVFSLIPGLGINLTSALFLVRQEVSVCPSYLCTFVLDYRKIRIVTDQIKVDKILVHM